MAMVKKWGRSSQRTARFSVPGPGAVPQRLASTGQCRHWIWTRPTLLCLVTRVVSLRADARARPAGQHLPRLPGGNQLDGVDERTAARARLRASDGGVGPAG